MLKLVYLLFLVFVCAHGQVLRRGSCPNVNVMQNFDMKKFVGVWYEQVHTRRWSGDLVCSVEHFSQTGPRSFYINSFTFSPSANRSYQIKGLAEFSSKTADVGLFNVTLPDLNLTGTVWVLGTDYKSYAVIWSCKNADSKYFENVMIVSRDKHASSKTVLNALSVLTSRKILKSSLTHVSQSGCPNYNGLLEEMNKVLNASVAQKIAPNSQISDIDIRIGSAPPAAMNVTA